MYPYNINSYEAGRRPYKMYIRGASACVLSSHHLHRLQHPLRLASVPPLLFTSCKCCVYFPTVNTENSTESVACRNIRNSTELVCFTQFRHTRLASGEYPPLSVQLCGRVIVFWRKDKNLSYRRSRYLASGSYENF